MNYGVRSSVREMTNLLVMFVVFCLVLMRCGSAQPTAGEPGSPYNADGSLRGAATATEASFATATRINDPTVQVGIDSAFKLTCDGLEYPDIEALYSYEVTSLKAQEEAKYPGYTADFEAQLGLNDLKYGEDWYAQDSSGSGYTATGKVGGDGRFQFAPSGNPNATFDIRVNKRVTLSMVKTGSPNIEFCWNYSGTASGGTGAPVIISTYSTSLTLYACTTSAQGMTLPTPATSVITSTVTGTSTDTGAPH